MNLFHRHKWVIISAAKGQDFLNNFGYEEVGGKMWGRPVTRFLLQCRRCGDISERILDGHFDDYATQAVNGLQLSDVPSQANGFSEAP